MITCMGGWCRSRDKCADYHATGSREPTERICPPGREHPAPLEGQRMTMAQLNEAAIKARKPRDYSVRTA